MLAFQGQLLKRAIEIAGGTKRLSIRLGADEHAIGLWLEGKATMPARVFLITADLVLEDDIARAAQDRRSAPRDGAVASKRAVQPVDSPRHSGLAPG
jgi:hypothetical protein